MRALLRRAAAVFRADALALVLATAALGAALMGPAVRLERAVFEYVFVLDITQSMNTPDYVLDGRPVSRLAYAKAALEYVIAALPCGSRVGLGAFTEYRSMLLLAPVGVCSAQTEFAETLEHVDGRMAWAGASEVAKGFYSALRLTKDLNPRPTLVFLTDGHEAPPLHPRHRPLFRERPGEVAGLVVGTGGFAPMPIPKYDMAGKSLGFWAADEVLQTDVYSRGRAANVADESMVEEDGTAVTSAKAGSEHLSMLKETHLQALAGETGLRYRRLTTPADLADALTAGEFARRTKVTTDLRPELGLVALFCLVWVYGGRRLRRGIHLRREQPHSTRRILRLFMERTAK